MDKYATGAVIRSLREKKGLTQEELAAKIHVSGKAVSKWETGHGFPDVSLLEPLAKALSISVSELISGECICNKNRSSNIRKSRFYVCPVCGNAIWAVGDAGILCCGLTLPALEAEAADEEHEIHLETVEDEQYIGLDHPMTKEHYISFLAATSDQGMQFIKLYPEGNAEARFKKNRLLRLYAYCNRHGLYQMRL